MRIVTVNRNQKGCNTICAKPNVCWYLFFLLGEDQRASRGSDTERIERNFM